MSVIFDGKDQGKKHSHLVFVGHRDHGKSSILGRLFYDTGNVGEKTMERIKTMAKEMNREGFEYAFVMDQIKEERMRGITIGLAHKKLLVDGISFTFADAPGHKDFIKNMLVGASESEASILVIDAKAGIESQTKEHLYLSKMLGVPRVVVALNKMDLVDYSQEEYERLESEITALIKKVGYDPQEVPIIPCSAMDGQNIAKKADKMGWYDGPTFLEVIENLPSRKVPDDLALRMPVQDVYGIDGKPWIVGRIESGTLSTGDSVIVMPSKKEYSVEEIEVREKRVEDAGPGDNLYLKLKGLEKDDVKRSNIIGKKDNPPKMVESFRAQVMVLNKASPLKEGHETNFEMLTEDLPAKVKKLVQLVDTTTGEITENPEQVKDGESAIIEFEVSEPVYIEKQSENPQLSSFRMQENRKNVGMGICVEASE